MLLSEEELAKREVKILAPYAVKSLDTKGRKFKEKKDQNRLCFQKDKERIIHCKAFRRLESKTQVFTTGISDHYRTRLTHTLEVAQISRDISRRLGLNEDLAEVIALAHDLGHSPFGHAGQEALDEVMHKFGMSYEHNEQSRRVVEKLEKSYPDFDGLNLSFEVIEGMIKHQTAWDQSGKLIEIFPHLEAEVVNIADEIAYVNHDIDDGLRSGMITLKELDKFKLWQKAKKKTLEKYGEIRNEQVLISRIVSRLMSMMVLNLCETGEKNLKRNKIKSIADVQKFKGALLTFDKPTQSEIKKLRNFLYHNFYFNPKIIRMVQKGEKMIKDLFMFFIKHPEKLPKTNYLDNKEELPVTVKDYIAGMTDNFLLKEYKKFIMKKS